MEHRVFAGIGHGGTDPGAVANGIIEAEANLTIGLAFKDEMSKYADVLLSRVTDEDDKLYEEIAECNDFKPECAIEIHNNAGGGDGFEVYVQTNIYADESVKLAECIEAEVKAIGQNSRGIKTKLNVYGVDWYGWLRQCNCSAVLLEGFFVDSDDCKIADTIEKQREFGKAYARGVMKYLGIELNANEAEIIKHSENDYRELFATFDAFRTRIRNAVEYMEDGR